MSEKIEHRGLDGEVVGLETHFSPRRPTKQSSGTHLGPSDADGALRLSVRCRQAQLLGVYGVEPPALRGRFTGDTLRLHGADIVAPRPDRLLGWLRAGRSAADYAELIVGTSAVPLQLWCPNHEAGHEIDPALLRAEVAQADRALSRGPWCNVERVEA